MTTAVRHPLDTSRWGIAVERPYRTPLASAAKYPCFVDAGPIDEFRLCRDSDGDSWYARVPAYVAEAWASSEFDGTRALEVHRTGTASLYFYALVTA